MWTGHNQLALSRMLIALAIACALAGVVVQTEAKAQYVETDVLRASQPGEDDHFGSSVDLDGDLAIVGAEDEDGPSEDVRDAGAAYVYERRKDRTWQEKHVLRASNFEDFDQFGSAVAVDDDIAVVGAWSEDGPSNSVQSSGAAYVFQRQSSGSWEEIQILRASNADPEDFFGISLALSDDLLVIGATGAEGISNQMPDAGAAYVFERQPGGTFSETQVLRSSLPGEDDRFGRSLSVSGDRIVVGAPFEDGPSDDVKDPGAAYVFKKTSNGNWEESQILRASNFDPGDQFGSAVAIDESRIAIGAPSEDGYLNSRGNAGAVYLFDRTETWEEQTILRDSGLEAKSGLGFAVALEGDRLVTGANVVKFPELDGGAVIFQQASDGTWEKLRRLNPTGRDKTLGTAVALSKERVLVGADEEDGESGNLTGAGAAYAFEPVISISAIRPSSGVPGQTVTIYGFGFGFSIDPSDLSTTVEFGSKRASETSVTSSAIEAKIPEGISGPVEVTVERKATSATAADLFTVIDQGNASFILSDAEFGGVDYSDSDWGDYDRDGDQDLVLTGRDDQGNPTTTLYRNEGDGSFTALDVGLADVEASSVDWGDYDQDGDLDLVITGANENGVSTTVIYRNDGQGEFIPIDANIEDVQAGDAKWVDFVGADARPDLSITGYNSDDQPSTTLYENKGRGQFKVISGGLPDVYLSAVSWGPGIIAIAGEKADGSLITGIYDKIPGTENFEPLDENLTGVRFADMEWADLNSDGNLDLIVVGESEDVSKSTTIYRGDGEGNFTPVDASFEPRDGSVEAGDFDADSIPDIALTGLTEEGGKTTLYRNGGNGSFADVGANLRGLAITSLNWVDYDGDGDLDLFVSGGNAENTKQSLLYRNAEIPPQPKEIPVDLQRSFGDATDAQDYRLVSLPGGINLPLSSAIEGEAGTEWQAFWDDGSEENFLVKHDGSEKFHFRPGRGFWATGLQPWSFEDSVESAPLDEKMIARVPLHDGWNIISNPLGMDVPWSEVKTANGADLQPAWAFDGSFSQAESFQSAASGEAYYFLNDKELSSLKVPFAAEERKSISADRSSPYSEKSLAPNGKEGSFESLLDLQAEVNRGGDTLASAVQLGVAENAEKGVGPEDIPAPPAGFSELSLRSISSGTVSKRRRTLARSLRRAEEENHEYKLQLRAEPGTDVRIESSVPDAMQGVSAALIDLASGQSYDLSREASYTVRMEDSTRALRVALGSEAFVKQERKAALPDEVSLTSYPNPAAQQATLEYALTNSTEVTLRLYDMLGRRVATLASGKREAGRHTVKLETDDLSSGVYFGRLQAGSQTRTHKITVMR